MAGRHRASGKQVERRSARTVEPVVPDQAGYRVGRGVAWSALNAGVLRLGQFAMSIVIARIVSPREFGVFVVALTVYTIIVNVSEVGVGAAVVREVDRTKEIAPTVASVAIGTSALLAALMAAAAPLLASALGSQAATDAVRVMALTVVIGGAGAVPAALLTRDYRQERRFAVDATVFVASNVVLVTLALLGAGVMALAFSRVVGQLVSTLMLVLLVSERYWPRFNPSEARRLLRFGLPLAGANLIGFTIGNVDFIVIGRLRGATPLGLYNLAYNISAWPVSIFTAILNNVTVTTLSRARHARAELEAHLTAAMSALCAASFPVSALCAALAGPLVDTVYGSRWRPAAAALVVLALFGSIRVVIALLSDLLVALGRTKRLLALQVIWVVALVPTMVLGVHLYGIVGAGLAHSVVGLVIVIPAYVLALRRRVEAGLGWLVRSIVPPLVAAALCGILAHVVAGRFSSPVLQLLVGSFAGVIIYAAALGWWLRSLLATLRGMYGLGVRSSRGASLEPSREDRAIADLAVPQSPPWSDALPARLVEHA